MASIQDFMELELVVGQIQEAAEHPDADRLYVLKVDIGEESPRQLVAGIRSAYGTDELKGKKVIMIKNLEPATIRGVESQGMILAASDDNVLAVVTPEKDIKVGSRVK